MSDFLLPLAQQELLHHMLQAGGQAACHMTKPAQTIRATFDVVLTKEHALVTVDVCGQTDHLLLSRDDRANHLHLRDLLQTAANRPHPGEPSTAGSN